MQPRQLQKWLWEKEGRGVDDDDSGAVVFALRVQGANRVCGSFYFGHLMMLWCGCWWRGCGTSIRMNWSFSDYQHQFLRRALRPPLSWLNTNWIMVWNKISVYLIRHFFSSSERHKSNHSATLIYLFVYSDRCTSPNRRRDPYCIFVGRKIYSGKVEKNVCSRVSADEFHRPIFTVNADQRVFSSLGEENTARLSAQFLGISFTAPLLHSSGGLLIQRKIRTGWSHMTDTSFVDALCSTLAEAKIESNMGRVVQSDDLAYQFWSSCWYVAYIRKLIGAVAAHKARILPSYFSFPLGR